MNSKIHKLKKNAEELQEYLKFKKRGFAVPAKKGKGSEYSRKEKHKSSLEKDFWFFKKFIV